MIYAVMDYLHTGILTNIREGFVKLCRDHFHEVSSYFKDSTNGLSRLGQKLNERISIKSRRLLHSRPTEDEVVHQSMILCRDYMYVKLRKHKLLSKDIYTKKNSQFSQLHFLRLKDENNELFRRLPKNPDGNVGSSAGAGPADVSKELIKVATEFEKCFPYLYEDIADQLQLNFQSPSSIHTVFNTVATDIFRKGITWARIIALYTLTGALVVECIKQGHQNLSNVVVEALQKFVRKRLAAWIIEQGGWVGLVIHFRQKQTSLTALRLVSIAGVLLGLCLVFWLPR